MYNVCTLFMQKTNEMYWLAYKSSADWILKGKPVGTLLELANRPRCIHNTLND